MATKKILFLLAIVILALFASGCTEKEPSAEEIAARMLEKQNSIEDYSYTMHMTYYIGETVVENEFKTIYKKPHMIKNVIEEPGGEEETLVLSDGEFRWTYAPGTNTVMKTEIPETPELTEDDYLSIIGITLNDTNVSLLGTEETEGREAYLLEATPKEMEEDTPAYSMKFWVDKETWMFLGYEMYDSNETLISKVEIRDLKVNTGIPDSEFEFKIPEGATVETVRTIKTVEYGEIEPPEELSLEEAREQASFEILTPEYLPEGYAFDNSIIFENSETAIEDLAYEIVTLTYKNGGDFVVISESVSEGEAGKSPYLDLDAAEDITINGEEGKYIVTLGSIKTMNWKIGNISLILTCNLEKAEMLKIAESIQEKA
jgi:outer membrane lipoprotein-sorting protein